MQGQIFKIHSDFYYVNSNEKIYECKIREVLKKTKQKIFVGDYVEFNNGAIDKILPRKNYITRPTVANIDQIIIISAVKEPELNFIQLNRYLSFAKYHNINAVLCFNKNDLSSDDSLIETVFSIYQPLGYDIVFTSAIEGQGIEDFKELLNGKVSVLCGASGVGKSSLINSICPNLSLRTGQISEKTSRGTHTTRHCEIVSINNNSSLVDTPGFSNLKFDFLMPKEISSLFDEFKPYIGHCKFQDCLHINEIGCSILENIENFSPSRYESYLEFVKEAKLYKEKVKYQGIKIESSHKFNNEKMAVKISSRKRQSARNTQKQNIYKDLEDE